MKKLAATDHLELNKEIIADLTEEQLREIEGGAGEAAQFSCFNSNCTTTGSVYCTDDTN